MNIGNVMVICVAFSPGCTDLYPTTIENNTDSDQFTYVSN